MLDRWTRFAPLTGIVFVGLFIATFVVGGSTPGVHATGVKVISYYKAHHSGQKASAYLGVLAVVFLLFFATALRTYLRRVEAARPFAVLGFAGAIVLAMSGAIFSALSWALVDGRNTLDPSAAQALNVLSNDFFWPLAVGVAVFGVGYGLAIARSGALPRWLGWIAFVLGVLGVTPLAFFAFLGLMAWSLVASTLIYLRSAPAAVAAAG